MLWFSRRRLNIIKPTVIELGEYEFYYNDEIVVKLAAITDPLLIGWRTPFATDENYPDDRTGKKRYKVSAVSFRQRMPDNDVARWCIDNKKIRARPKEGIDVVRVSPRPALDNVMPLNMSGQFFVSASRRRRALYFRCRGAERRLDRLRGHYWLSPFRGWGGRWWFLVLEELPPAD